MYQALYRKYRPNSFEEVAGQDVVVKTLTNAVINNKINHAYLFAGPRGCGKTTIAKIFARLVNCKNNKNGLICNNCVCCTQNNDQNMDIIEMDAASNNGVDEIREINAKVNLAPTLGKYKIYIIDEVHMLTIGAFNALLKTLEEPPEHVIFILATTDPHKVPITILSRCQRFDLKKISDEKIFDRLKYICDKENIEIDDESIKEISKLGDGSLRDAISVLDQVIAYANTKITLDDVHEVNGTISKNDIFNLINEMINNNLSSVINNLTIYNNKGKSVVKIAEDIIYFLKDIILYKTTTNFITDTDNIYSTIANRMTKDQLLEKITIMNEALIDMKKFSNPKMILELAFIRMIDFKTNTINNKKEVESIDNQEEQLNKISQKESKKNITDEINQQLNNFITIRVNNTLSKFSKKETLYLKTELKKVMDYVMDEKYNIYATMILDGELKAVSDEYAIFAYATIHLSNLFNENITKIENLINLVLNKHYKVIAVDLEKWNIIKDNFNTKKQIYKYQEENINIDEIIKKLNKEETDDMQSLFGEIVEYN